MEAANFSPRRPAIGALPAFSLPPPTAHVPSVLPGDFSESFHNSRDANLNAGGCQGSQALHGIQSYGSHIHGGSRYHSSLSYSATPTQPSLGQDDLVRPASWLYNHNLAMQQLDHPRSCQPLATREERLPPPSHQPYAPFQSLPAMGGSATMSNIHQPGGQVSMIPRIGVSPYQDVYHTMIYGHSQPRLQSDRPFKCDQCVLSFSRNHDLKRHKRVHLAVKPFPCTFCDKTFSRKDSLKRHRLSKGCGKTSVKREDSEPGQNSADISTKDCKPGLEMRASNQPLQPSYIMSSLDNSPFPTTSRGDEPPSQDGIRLPTAHIKTEVLEDSIETFSKPALSDCSQQHRLPILPKLSEIPDDRVSSQTPHSEGSSAVTERYIDERKGRIINSIVFSVTQWLRSKFDSCRKNAGCNSTDASGTSEARWGSHPKTKPSNSIKPNNGKRKLTDNDHETDDDGDDGHEEDEQSSHRPMQSDEPPKYACPYFKYNPAKYKDWRICPGPGWTDVHRVKEHLYRRHRQPKYRCGRCWQHFKDEEGYLNHQRTPQPCSLREMEHVEGFDAAQERSLKSRKRANPELSETEKWKRVFQILFPHVLDDDIPSPFYEYNQISQKEGRHQDSESDYMARCEEYMVREVPQRLRQALGRELDRDLNIVEESLRRKAGDWVKTLLEEAFRELRHNRRPDGPSQPLAVDDEMPGLTEGSGRALVPNPQPHNLESSVPHFEGESEAWPLNFDLDSFDPFTILGETELSFDNGGLLENLLQPEEGKDGESKKHSDSGYGSHSPT